MRSLVAGLLCVACGGELAPSPARPSVAVSTAALVDDGDGITGTIQARVTAPSTEGATVHLWAGAMPERSTLGYCDLEFEPRCRYVGWLLELVDGEPIDLGPGEARDVRLTVRSGNRPTSNPNAAVARCGEKVTVVLVPTGDGAQGGGFQVDYQCALSALRKR